MKFRSPKAFRTSLCLIPHIGDATGRRAMAVSILYILHPLKISFFGEPRTVNGKFDVFFFVKFAGEINPRYEIAENLPVSVESLMSVPWINQWIAGLEKQKAANPPE